MAGITNTQISEQLKELENTLAAFKTQYDQDMRGDTRLNGGAKGLINEVREIKQYHKDHPSITWLLAHKTLPTVGVLLGVFAVLMFLWSAGLFSVISKMFGVDVAMPLP